MRAQTVLGFLLFCGSALAQPYVISTIAGGSAPPTPAVATKASIGDATRVAADAAGNVYVAAYGGGEIDQITPADILKVLTPICD